MYYCIHPKFSDRQVWANIVDPDQTAVWSGSTLFAILSSSFWLITLWYSHIVQIWATLWENLFSQYANNKGTDQLAHLRSLSSTFVVRFLDSIIPLLPIQNFKPLLVSEGKGWFECYLVENHKDRFSRDMAHFKIIQQLFGCPNI